MPKTIGSNIKWLRVLYRVLLNGYHRQVPKLVSTSVMLMQHHHEDSNWYYDSDWDYVSGALNTFDYRYGFLNALIRLWHHDIANYHVVHHLFASVPRYNFKGVTEELADKKVLKTTPKNFSYVDYFKIIWKSNFVENKTDGQTQYALKSYEEL